MSENETPNENSEEEKQSFTPEEVLHATSLTMEAFIRLSVKKGLFTYKEIQDEVTEFQKEEKERFDKMNAFKKKVNKLRSNSSIRNFSATKDINSISYNLGCIEFVKYRICECLIMNFNLAAMTLTNHYLEKSLKILLIYHDSHKYEVTYEDPSSLNRSLQIPTKEFDNKDLYKIIEFLFDRKLISQEEKDALDEMRHKYRNALSHSDRRKLYGEATNEWTYITGKEGAEDLVNNNIDNYPKEELSNYNVPMADFLFIKQLSDNEALDYFLRLDTIVVNIIKKVFPDIEPKYYEDF